MAGRPSKFNIEIANAIIENLRLGNYTENASAAAGLAKSTLYAWLERGRKEQERIEAGLEPIEAEHDFMEFSNAVEKARAEAVARNVAIIQKSAHSGTWQAAAWWLERTQQKVFGRKQQLEHTGSEGQAIKLEVSTQEIEDKVKRILNERSGKNHISKQGLIAK